MSEFYGSYNGHMWSHFLDCKKKFKDNQIIMLALTGSQNYDLATEASDLDTKLTVLPSIEDIMFNKPAISTTHIRENQEHIDFKDLRLMFPTLLKQNVNYVEQLFSSQYIVNLDYEKEIESLFDIKEDIARFCPSKCIKTMFGIAMNKQSRVFRTLPEKENIIETYGYNPKEMLQLLRIEEFMRRYINGEPFADCLKTQQREFLLRVKSGSYFNSKEILEMLNESVAHVEEMKENFLNTYEATYIPGVQIVLYDIQKRIMMKYLKNVIK